MGANHGEMLAGWKTLVLAENQNFPSNCLLTEVR